LQLSGEELHSVSERDSGGVGSGSAFDSQVPEIGTSCSSIGP